MVCSVASLFVDLYAHLNADINTTPTLEPLMLIERKSAPLKKAKWHLGASSSYLLSQQVFAV